MSLRLFVHQTFVHWTFHSLDLLTLVQTSLSRKLSIIKRANLNLLYTGDVAVYYGKTVLWIQSLVKEGLKLCDVVLDIRRSATFGKRTPSKKVCKVQQVRSKESKYLLISPHNNINGLKVHYCSFTLNFFQHRQHATIQNFIKGLIFNLN